MHDRFEKEVQQKMEGLNLTPSAPVWEKIELEIKPEKKRRRIFFWLFAGILLTGIGFFSQTLWKGDKAKGNADKTVAVAPSEAKINVPAEKQTIGDNKKSVTVKTEKNKQTQNSKPSLAHLSLKQTSIADYPISAQEQIKNSAQARKTGQPKKQLTVFEKEQNSVITNHTKIAATANNQPSINTTTVADTTAQISSSTLSISTTKTEQPADTISQTVEQKTTPQTATDSNVKKKIAVTKGWKKQIMFGAGSNSQATLSSKALAYNDANFQAGVGTAAPIVTRPSPINDGFAFQVGFSLSKKIGKNFEWSVGLQYVYYSTKQKVGSSYNIDTVLRDANKSIEVNRFYTNQGTEQYTNQFHAIELPVSFRYQPGVSIPVSVTVGAAYGRLISTNALSYYRASNVYYQNKEAFEKNMLPVSVALQVELFKKKKAQLLIGPALQYNLLKLRRDDADGAPHLFFAGLKSSINF